MPRNGRITEGEFQTSLRRAARDYGWQEHVPWKSLHSPKGWADLTLGAKGRLWFAYWELKNDTGKPTPEQIMWLNWWRRFADGVMAAFAVADEHHHVLEDVRISVALLRPADIESAYRYLLGRPKSEGWPEMWVPQ